jgi:hypothetical protein
MPRPSAVRGRFASIFIAVVLTVSASGEATLWGQVATESEAPVVAVDAAASQAGQLCIVEMTVRSARQLDDKETCFLNSAKNHRDEGNFTAVIFRAGFARFREAGIDRPAEHFLDKEIRVRGVVSLRDERPQIVVEDPAQIEIVAAAAGE